MLLLYAIATKNLSECISQQNYCILLATIKHSRLYFFTVFITIGKLQNLYVVFVAVILNLAVSVRAANSLLLYALA